jgi:hypothetical protein
VGKFSGNSGDTGMWPGEGGKIKISRIYKYVEKIFICGQVTWLVGTARGKR